MTFSEKETKTLQNINASLARINYDLAILNEKFKSKFTKEELEKIEKMREQLWEIFKDTIN